jgi:hypothetical protein
VIDLSEREWVRLYKEVAVIAQRMTYTKVEKQRWTARDRAQEAVQRAFERFLTLRPEAVRSFDEARAYLLGAVRSELWNVHERGETRREAEKAAVVEEATVTGGAAPAAEQMQLEHSGRVSEQARAARIVELTREELKDDRIALGTMECIAREQAAPAEQAKTLGCTVEEVYSARMRRKRAMTRALARYERERKLEGKDEE